MLVKNLIMQMKGIKFWVGFVLLTLANLIGIFLYGLDSPIEVSGFNAMIYNLMLITIYTTAIPLIVGMAYSSSYFDKKTSGYLYYLVSRAGLLRYYMLELVSGFAIGFILVFGSFWISLLAVIGWYGSTPFDGGNALLSGYWAELFRRNPWMFMVWISANMSIAGGAFTLLGIGFSHLFKKRYFISMGPFLYYIGLTVILSILQKPLYTLFGPYVSNALLYIYPITFLAPFTIARAGMPVTQSSHLAILDMLIGWGIVIGVICFLILSMYYKDKRELI